MVLTHKRARNHNCRIKNCSWFHSVLNAKLLHTFNDFLGYHYHWMDWLGATININDFSMVLRLGNHWFQWFTMLSTIGLTMEWLLTTVEVCCQYLLAEREVFPDTSLGMDLWRENVLTLPKLGKNWKIHPWCLRDFLRSEIFPKAKKHNLLMQTSLLIAI